MLIFLRDLGYGKSASEEDILHEATLIIEQISQVGYTIYLQCTVGQRQLICNAQWAKNNLIAMHSGPKITYMNCTMGQRQLTCNIQ